MFLDLLRLDTTGGGGARDTRGGPVCWNCTCGRRGPSGRADGEDEGSAGDSVVLSSWSRPTSRSSSVISISVTVEMVGELGIRSENPDTCKYRDWDVTDLSFVPESIPLIRVGFPSVRVG